MRLRSPLLILIIIFYIPLYAQDIPIEGQKRIFFPYPADRNWSWSLGVTATTLPLDITEEFRYRLPAGDVHFVRKLGKKMLLDGRVSIQVLQNLITLGPKYTSAINDRLSYSIGADAGFWFGFIKARGINARGIGYQVFPNVSFGYRFNKRILLTARAEQIMNIAVKTYAGETRTDSEYPLFSGSSFALVLEQPFFKDKSLSLGFRAIYTNFFWQTWSLYEAFDRNIFFPQIIIGVIL